MKHFKLKLLLLLSIHLSLLPQLSAQSDVSSGDEIPYGFVDLDFGIYRSHEISYIIRNKDVNGVLADYAEKNSSSKLLGIGLEVHYPLIYSFLNNDNSRFRIADDIGFGIYGLSGVGLQGFAGIQTAYRISDVLDIGAKYYPFYGQTDYRSTVGNNFGRNAIGLHARIGRFYLDYTNIFGKNKNRGGTFIPFNLIKIKFLYNDDYDEDYPMNCFTFQLGFAKFKAFPNIDPKIGPGYQEIASATNRYSYMQLGWGMTF